MSALRKRAIYDEDKEVRRKQILAAARKLFWESGGCLATVTEVARHAGIAKGTIYLYFQTKEELYIAYYEELLTELLQNIQALCGEKRKGTGGRIVDAICDFSKEHPEFLRLAGLMNGVLEQNVSEEFVYGYKSRLASALLTTANHLSGAFPGLSFEEAARLFLRSYAFAVGLWQQADLPPVVKKLFQKRPELALFQVDFLPELKSGLMLLWKEA
ncbi:MAG: TetR family transcriptional regulator [Bdellovibrionota bacterium]